MRPSLAIGCAGASRDYSVNTSVHRAPSLHTSRRASSRRRGRSTLQQPFSAANRRRWSPVGQRGANSTRHAACTEQRQRLLIRGRLVYLLSSTHGHLSPLKSRRIVHCAATQRFISLFDDPCTAASRCTHRARAFARNAVGNARRRLPCDASAFRPSSTRSDKASHYVMLINSFLEQRSRC